MVAAPDLGSGAARRGGSSPFIRTNTIFKDIHSIGVSSVENPDCTGCWIFEIRLKEVEASPFLPICNMIGIVSNRVVVQLVRMPHLGCGCRRFESGLLYKRAHSSVG